MLAVRKMLPDDSIHLLAVFLARSNQPEQEGLQPLRHCERVDKE